MSMRWLHRLLAHNGTLVDCRAHLLIKDLLGRDSNRIVKVLRSLLGSCRVLNLGVSNAEEIFELLH